MDDGAKLHLKEWLIVQIESGEYEGLCWEDENKTMFRIPWKHAAKKDYKQTEDAALFKAWAVYKGKYREGRDRADPTMWKTRLRCALNKSTDFQEVPERNQLDITEPYKVYRIQHDNSQSRPAVDCSDTLSRAPYWPFSVFPNDFRMQVMLVYQGQIVTKVTTRSPDGCFILQGHVPLGNEKIYGPCTAQQLSFPSPGSVCQPPTMAEAMNRLLCHLERGVLLWVAPDGVFIKRFCQGRVYWNGPMAQHIDKPNKLEREKTFKLLDIPTFLNGLQNCLQGRGPTPSYEIELCFGEEYPDPNVPKTKKLIMAQVVPLFAVELLQRFNLAETEDKPLTITSNTAGEKM
uniref:Interferon regulatory factor 10 n=1 Tax=Haplochromis burtoni TaxID=8153 RepID=A0A3Q2V6G0_HAPBU